MVIVVVKKSQLNYFRKIARDSFPLECQAYLIGEIISPNKVIVHSFVYPKYYKKQEKGGVQWTSEEYTELKKKLADEDKLQLIGDIHSHPLWDSVMSPQDYKSAIIDCLRVCGIVSVYKRKTRVRFWVPDSALAADIKFI